MPVTVDLSAVAMAISELKAVIQPLVERVNALEDRQAERSYPVQHLALQQRFHSLVVELACCELHADERLELGLYHDERSCAARGRYST